MLPIVVPALRLNVSVVAPLQGAGVTWPAGQTLKLPKFTLWARTAGALHAAQTATRIKAAASLNERADIGRRRLVRGAFLESEDFGARPDNFDTRLIVSPDKRRTSLAR